MTQPDTLTALDWHAYACQCPKHGKGCSNQASYTVEIHALEVCNEPGLNAFGNRVELRCASCVRMLHDQLEMDLRQLNKVTHGRAHCGGCGAPVAEVSDVLRAVSKL
jgi:hypothetical protein